jgi:hypothetical protein
MINDVELPIELQEEQSVEDVDPDLFDASNPQAVNAAKKRAARERAEDLRIVKIVMDAQDGRKWMYRLLNSCNIFSTTFIAGDPYASAFHEGQRDRGLRILSDIMEACPDNYVKMCKENS